MLHTSSSSSEWARKDRQVGVQLASALSNRPSSAGSIVMRRGSGYRAGVRTFVSERLFRVLIVLLLATIGLQATPSRPVGLELDQGSAFSATTVDVAVAERRQWSVEVKADALPEPTPTFDVLRTSATSISAPNDWPATYAIGPPNLPIFILSSGPRGPPTA